MYIDEVLDYLKCGKKIRRTIWPSLFYLDKKEDDLILSVEDLLADDWEVDDWEVVEEKKKWWEPKINEQYWYIKSTGIVDCNNCDNDKVDKLFMAIGNCFQTEEQAEFMAEKLKVIHELEKFACENNSEEIDWSDVNQEKLYLGMNLGMNSKIKSIDIFPTDIFPTCSWIYIPFNVFFTSEVIARKAIETIGEERIKKYYFGVG